jgi:hypothetical protein
VCTQFFQRVIAPKNRTHLYRYLAEFDIRYNERKVTDGERAETALKGIKAIA